MYISFSLVLAAVCSLVDIGRAAPVDTTSFKTTSITGNQSLALAKRELIVTQIGCNHVHGCPVKNVTVDLDLPQASMTCPRLALAALAAYRIFCTKDSPQWAKWCREADVPPYQPSIESCCGEWVYTGDPFYLNYPRARNGTSGIAFPEMTGQQVYDSLSKDDAYYDYAQLLDNRDGFYRRVLRMTGAEYNDRSKVCNMFVPEYEGQYQYFNQNWNRYEIDELEYTVAANVDGYVPPNDGPNAPFPEAPYPPDTGAR